jgi:hypothetical protein
MSGPARGAPSLAKNDTKNPGKSEQRAATEQRVAEFLARGGAIKRGPDVVPTLITCGRCYAQSVVGVAAQQRRSARCPKCGGIVTP